MTEISKKLNFLPTNCFLITSIESTRQVTYNLKARNLKKKPLPFSPSPQIKSTYYFLRHSLALSILNSGRLMNPSAFSS